MKKLKPFTLLVFMIGLCSCGSLAGGGGVTKTNTKTFSPTEPSSIEIFISDKPSEEYFEIGMVSVSRVNFMFYTPRKPEEIQKEMREEASKIGGNAIINYKESGIREMTGTVVRYKKQ